MSEYFADVGYDHVCACFETDENRGFDALTAAQILATAYCASEHEGLMETEPGGDFRLGFSQVTHIKQAAFCDRILKTHRPAPSKVAFDAHRRPKKNTERKKIHPPRKSEGGPHQKHRGGAA